MRKSNLIAGVICLAAAALFGVLLVTLPEGKIIFMIEGQNRPIVLPIGLGVIGALLIVSANLGRAPETERPVQAPAVVDEKRAALNKRLETIAWGCFLIMLGGFLFVPEQIIRGGWWSIGVGTIMLGLNAARLINGLKMSGFTVFLGIAAIISGTMEVIGLYDLDGAVLLIVLGGYLLIKPAIEKRQLFGKAEEA